MALMGRLRMPNKLIILALLFMAPLSTTLYATIHSALQAYRATLSEQDGIAMLATTQDLLKAVQVRRGAGAAVLAGNAGMRSAFDSSSAAADASLTRLIAQAQASTHFDMRAQPKALADRYAQLSAAGLGPTGTALFESHTRLVREIFLFERDLANLARLALDPDEVNAALIDTVAFELPSAAETAGLTRGKGAAALSAGALADLDRGVLQTRAALLDEQSAALRHALSGIREAQTGPAVGAKLSAIDLSPYDTFRQTVAALAREGAPALDASAFFQQGTDAIAALYGAHATLSQLARDRLNTRARHERNEVIVLSLLSAMSIGCALYLFAAFALRTQRDVAALSTSMAAIGTGDLRASLAVDGKDEFASIKRGLNALVAAWTQTIAATRGAAQSVLVGSGQIAAGNQDLSQRTETQAASLQETAASMEQLTSTVRHNASNAANANKLSAEASERASRTGSIVTSAVDIMKQVHDGSTRMAEIVSVIEGIAFQTNILALNAAVEAARAGEQGKGFGVVAGEVRALAHRSAAAAKDVKALIQTSIERVTGGSALFVQVDGAIHAVIDAIADVDRIVGEIADASEQQSDGIEQVNVAIAQMDEVTQRNAALVEESAAASASLQEQAEQMERLVARFQLA
ncbi:methyl-accepting chemotaxis protein [Trinickia dabaoshanensis]